MRDNLGARSHPESDQIRALSEFFPCSEGV
jgi:hypothetical protein